MRLLRLLLAAALAAVLPSAQAKVYTCVVNDGVVYTAKPNGNCQQAKLQPIGSYSNSAAYRNTNRAPTVSIQPRARASTRNTTPSSATATVSTAPRGNDSGRRRILEQELNNERSALNLAQKALTDGRTMQTGDKGNYNQYQARIRQLEGAVLDRQQNVQALQRELGRM